MTVASASSVSFRRAFLAEVSSSLLSRHARDYDKHGAGESIRSLGSVRSVSRNLVEGSPKKKGRARIGDMARLVRLVAPNLAHFQSMYDSLDDQQSRELLVKLPLVRCLGPGVVEMPLDTPSYWEGLRNLERLADKSDSLHIGSTRRRWELFRIDLAPAGYPTTCYLTPWEAYMTFALQQYMGSDERGTVQVELADCVVDAGACFGDTALYFAHRTGPAGKVYSFESNPRNLEILKRNLALNPELGRRVQLVEGAVWSKSSLCAFVEEKGPGSAVGLKETGLSDGTVDTLTLDDFVASEALPRVDFIKMDVEGAELPALKGAVQTLRRFTPKLAIAVYHRPTDLFEIPEFIRSLGLGYRLFLRHFTVHSEETVLFAQAKAG